MVAAYVHTDFFPIFDTLFFPQLFSLFRPLFRENFGITSFSLNFFPEI